MEINSEELQYLPSSIAIEVLRRQYKRTGKYLNSTKSSLSDNLIFKPKFNDCMSETDILNISNSSLYGIKLNFSSTPSKRYFDLKIDELDLSYLAHSWLFVLFLVVTLYIGTWYLVKYLYKKK
jgi:hypothetical protein